MNEENWVETTKMRKYRKWKDRKLKNGKKICWIGNAGERKEEWKAATREKEGNDMRNWENHHIGVIGIWSGKGEEEEIEKKRFNDYFAILANLDGGDRFHPYTSNVIKSVYYL